MGFAIGAVGGGLHNTTRGWGGGVSVAAPCQQGSSMPTTVAAPCHRQWPAPKEVFGRRVASGGLHSIARG